MKKAIEFVKEAWLELKQVTWLTTPQMAASTVIVLVLVVIVAAYIGVVDYVLSFLFRIII